MSRRKLTLAATVVLALCVMGPKPIAQTVWSDLPAANQQAEDIGKKGAEKSNMPELKAAIENGTVNIYPGRPATGHGASWPNGDGTYTIIAEQAGTAEWFFWIIVHEWTHISSGHPLPPKPGTTPPPGAPTPQGQACIECDTHCSVLWAMKRVADNGGKVKCADVEKVKFDAGWECLWCGGGMGAFGPPAPSPCGDPDIHCVP